MMHSLMTCPFLPLFNYWNVFVRHNNGSCHILFGCLVNFSCIHSFAFSGPVFLMLLLLNTPPILLPHHVCKAQVAQMRKKHGVCLSASSSLYNDSQFHPSFCTWCTCVLWGWIPVVATVIAAQQGRCASFLSFKIGYPWADVVSIDF